MTNQRSRGIVGIIILVMVFFVLFLSFAMLTLKSVSMSEKDLGQEQAQIAVVEVEEVIFESKSVIERLQKAEEDEKIKGIIVRIDSPGGAVGPTQEIYNEIIRIDEIKPVYASMGSIAASGGYYIAAAARKIYANPGTLTGSIGVIMHFMDLSKLYEFLKISPQVVKAGRYKDIGQPGRPMSSEEKIIMEDVINGVHEQFRKDILKRREAKIKGNFQEYTQGQIFSGEDALKAGLVDGLGGLWDAGRFMQKDLGIEEKLKFKFIKIKEKKFMDLLTELQEAFTDLKFGSVAKYIPMFLYQPETK